jgi:hypothetical protein
MPSRHSTCRAWGLGGEETTSEPERTAHAAAAVRGRRCGGGGGSGGGGSCGVRELAMTVQAAANVSGKGSRGQNE